MKFRFFSILALAGLLLGSCAMDERPAEGGSINAEMETDQTRTAVTDEGTFTWSAGDKVWLQTTSGSVLGTLSSGAGSSSAKFTYDGFVGELTGNAVYPYNDGHSVSGEVLNFVLPASYDLGSSLTNTNAAMYGVNVGGTIKFNHLAGVMRFKFKNVPAGVNKFTITLDKKINGTFSADLTADYPVIETSSSSAASEKTITLNFNALTAKSDISIYVPLPIGTYNSLELGLYDDGQSVWTYSKSVTNTVNRKSLKLMPVVTLGGSIGGEIEGDGTSEESDFIEILSGSRISFPAIDPKELTSIISTNIKEFDIEIPDDATWITDVDIDTSRNDGTVAINITVDENMSSESRQATIKICKKGHHEIYKEIDIYQEEFYHYLSLDNWATNSLEIEPYECYGETLGKLSTNLSEFDIEIYDVYNNWLELEIDKENNVRIARMEENSSTNYRAANIRISPTFESDKFVDFKITQLGYFMDIESGSYMYFSDDPTPKVALISTNIREFEVEIPESATWISEVSINTERNDGKIEVQVTLDKNMSGSREATIKICKKGHHEIYKEIDIYQDKFNWYLSIDYVKGNSLLLDSGSHYGYVVGKLRTNLPEYTIRKDKEHKWIDIYIDSNNNVIVNLSNNPEPDMRIAEFYFYPSFEYSCCEQFKIAQKGTGE